MRLRINQHRYYSNLSTNNNITVYTSTKRYNRKDNNENLTETYSTTEQYFQQEQQQI